MLELTLNSWVFADPHYNHRKLVEHGYRPDGYEAMISKSWAENVQPNDIVYCLCDVCFSRQRYKILLRGNHDQQKDSWYLSHGWNEIYETLLVQHEQKRILLSHIPQLDDGSWDLNLHGHLTNHQKVDILTS
jgi:calcineurin-like phosphoesterase family protein